MRVETVAYSSAVKVTVTVTVSVAVSLLTLSIFSYPDPLGFSLETRSISKETDPIFTALISGWLGAVSGYCAYALHLKVHG